MPRAMTRAGVVGAAVLAGVVGLALPAGAAITSPAANASLSGIVTLSDNGANSGGLNEIIFTCNGSTNMFVDSGTGTSVGSTTVLNLGTVSSDASSNPESGSWNTNLVPNGGYTVNSTEVQKKSVCITTTTTHASAAVTVNNLSSLVYGGVNTAAQGTSINVSATLTDTAGVAPPTAQTVSFGFTGQTAVNASTNTTTGKASATLTVPQGAGVTNLAVTYGGGFYSSKTVNVPFTITKDPVTVTASSPGATVYGQPVSFHASVTSQVSGEPTPSGTVQFVIDGSNYGSPVNLVNGSAASPADSALVVGAHSVQAVYSGDGNFLGNSGSTTQTVNQAVTALTLQSSVQSSEFGEAVDYTAQVTTQAPGVGVPTGTVSFTETLAGGSPQPIGGAVNLTPTTNPNQSGAQSVSIAVLSPGSYTITAIYSGGTGSNFATSQASITQVVSPAGTMVTLSSSSPSGAVHGQPVQFTATVQAVAPGVGTPTGSVDFNVDGTTDLGSVPLSNGSATSAAISTLSTTTHTITATYTNVDGNFVSGTKEMFQQQVLPDPTTTIVKSAPDPSVFGQPVQFTATVTANPPGAGTPTGSIQFTINGSASGSPVGLNANGVATSPALATLQPGTYTISAIYSNTDGNFDGSANPASSLVDTTQTVNQDPTTTTVASSVNPTVFGQPTTFTATVSANAPGAGTPTGTVTFKDGTNVLGTGTLNGTVGNDQATFTTAGLSVGGHAISAVYGGDPDFLTSTGNLNQTVNQDPSVTTVTQNGQAVQGQPISFTAAVAAAPPGAGTPTGTVIFEINGAPFGPPETLVNGSATSTSLSNLTPGNYEATAVYSGDVDFLPSSNSVGQVVNPASTATSLQVSPTTSAFGTPISLTATVTPTGQGTGTPTGTVAFYDGKTLLASQPLNSQDVATTTDTEPTVGAHSYTAVYSGEYDYAGSRSAAIPATVTGISTTTALGSSQNPSQFGQPVTFTANVTPAITTSPGPTGTVTFSDGSTTLGTATLTSSGSTYTASLTVSTLAVGGHNVTAAYGGDASYPASSSGPLTQTVTKAITSINAEPATNRGVITAVLSTAYGPVAGAELTFTVGPNNATLCTATTNASGVATCMTGPLRLEALALYKAYEASYAGNADYLAATAKGGYQ